VNGRQQLAVYRRKLCVRFPNGEVLSTVLALPAFGLCEKGHSLRRRSSLSHRLSRAFFVLCKFNGVRVFLSRCRDGSIGAAAEAAGCREENSARCAVRPRPAARGALARVAASRQPAARPTIEPRRASPRLRVRREPAADRHRVSPHRQCGRLLGGRHRCRSAAVRALAVALAVRRDPRQTPIDRQRAARHILEHALPIDVDRGSLKHRPRAPDFLSGSGRDIDERTHLPPASPGACHITAPHTIPFVRYPHGTPRPLGSQPRLAGAPFLRLPASLRCGGRARDALQSSSYCGLLPLLSLCSLIFLAIIRPLVPAQALHRRDGHDAAGSSLFSLVWALFFRRTDSAAALTCRLDPVFFACIVEPRG